MAANKIDVKIVLDGGSLPEYKKDGDAGADARVLANPANPDGHYCIHPGRTVMVSTGIRLGIPDGYEVQVRSRSGLAKRGLVVANAPGTIDSAFVGILKVLLLNTSDAPLIVEAGDRVAQLVLKRAPQANFVLVEKLEETERGEGGIGSTGVK